MRLFIGLLVGVAVSGAVCQHASADVTIEMKHNEWSQILYVAEHAFCVEHPEGTMIFIADKEILWAIDGKAKSYQEITKEDLQKVDEQMAAMKPKMEEAVKNMPPEQRAMVEKMMSGKLDSAMPAEKEITVKSLDAEREINGFETDGFEIYRDGVLHEEVWTASPKALGLTAKDFEVFKEFSDFVGTGIPSMEDMVDRFAKDFEKPVAGQAPGFPVLTIGKDPSGEETDRTELIKVEKEKINSAKFELPEGLKKQSSGLE